MRVCILGAGGMLGHMLVRVLSDDHDVYGTAKQEWSETAGLARFLEKKTMDWWHRCKRHQNS